MCKILNKHAVGTPAGAVYIGRGSKWGNPFKIGQHGDSRGGRRQARSVVARSTRLAALDWRASGQGPSVLLRTGGVPR